MDKSNKGRGIVAPSILSADFSDLKAAVEIVERSDTSWLHLDVMDGIFVPNITFGPKMIRDIRRITNLTLDTHLMITEPDRFIGNFAESGSDYITIHLEASIHAHRSLSYIHDYGKKAGISIVPSTPVIMLEELLPMVDMVLIMSVNPGFGGQKLIEKTLDKLIWLKEKREKYNLNYLIEIDGGINRETCLSAVASGADVLVSGSAIFNSDDPLEEIEYMLKCFQNNVQFR